MPFIRLSDNYIDNPKFLALSEGSFCLWHEGMAYTRKHQTDGIIPFAALKTFRFHTKGREKQLSAPHVEGANPLWILIPKTGYRVHDYLEWNPSRDEENERRAESKERMRQIRERRKTLGTPDVRANISQTNRARSHDVLDRIGVGEGFDREKGFGEKPDPFLDASITERAGRFIDRYTELYPKHRHGARYAVKPQRDYQAAVTLCETWTDDARLEKLAVCFLTTNHQFAAGGSRTIPQFLALASWCDGELAQWEAKQTAS